MAEAGSEYELVFTRAQGFERRPLSGLPEPGPGEVLVRPRFVGICGSDLFLMEGQEGELRLGHEWVGVVERVGPAVSGIAPGQSVTSTGTLFCGSCGYCAKQETHFCDHAEYLSSDRLGALRSWMLVSAENLVVIGGSLSPAQVLHEVVAVAEEGMRLLRRELPAPPKELLILGGGPIGTMQALVARRSGVKPLVIEKREHRIEAVRNLGLECVSLAQALVDPRFAGRFEVLADATNDGQGDSGAFRHLPVFVKKGFVALIIGKYLKPQEIPRVFNRMGGRLVWMRGMPQSTLRESVARWNGEIEALARGYVCEVFPSENANQAFDFAATRKSAMKVVIGLAPHEALR